MDRKIYICPKCERFFTGITAFMKHVNSKKCKMNQEKDARKPTGSRPR